MENKKGLKNKASLVKELHQVKSKIENIVHKRMKELSLNNNSFDSQFHELCYCILAANTSSEMADRICKAVSSQKFQTLSVSELKETLSLLRCRFYNKRSEYIYLAKTFDLEKIHQLGWSEKREYLLQVKGIGMKEASHFLRNIGYFEYAILDKHVISILKEYTVIRKVTPLSKKRYEYIEKKLEYFCKNLNVSQGELDFYLWYMKTNKVMK